MVNNLPNEPCHRKEKTPEFRAKKIKCHFDKRKRDLDLKFEIEMARSGTLIRPLLALGFGVAFGCFISLGSRFLLDFSRMVKDSSDLIFASY